MVAPDATCQYSLPSPRAQAVCGQAKGQVSHSLNARAVACTACCACGFTLVNMRDGKVMQASVTRC